MAQVKIGKPDFYPMTQKIEEVSIFFPTNTPSSNDVMMHPTRLDTQPSVACGWSGGSNAQKSMKKLYLRKHDGRTDRWIDRWTDGWTDRQTNGHTLL